MKKVVQLLVAIVMGVGLVGNVVGAEEMPDCNNIVITNTGDDANNDGTCVINRTVTVECIDNVYVLNQNDQTAVTGQANVIGNTSDGTAITGDAKNANGTTVRIGAECSTPTTPTTTPTTPTQSPTTASSTPAAQPAPAKKVAVLPHTAASSITNIALVATIATIAALVVARLAITVYRRVTLK